MLQRSRPFPSQRVPLVLGKQGEEGVKLQEVQGARKKGELDRDLCGFWKRVASSNVVLPTSFINAYEFLEDQLDVHIGSSLSP